MTSNWAPCVTIDRATTGRTVIGAGTKLDNQVQMAHNVQDRAQLRPQRADGHRRQLRARRRGHHRRPGRHRRPPDDRRRRKIGAQAGVIRDVPKGATVFGYPALDFQESFRITAALRRLPAALGAVADAGTQAQRRCRTGGGTCRQSDQNDNRTGRRDRCSGSSAPSNRK